LSKKGLLNIIESLFGYIKNLKLKGQTEWSDYYDKTNYSDVAFKHKSAIINSWINNLNPTKLIDIGGNDGTFVRFIDYKIEENLVCDIDNNAVDINYLTMKKNKEKDILPFVLDVLNPSPAIGLNNKERSSFLERIKQYSPDVTMALAVIHHMSLSGNVPFIESAKFFSIFSKDLIIEFPNRNDSWVKRLLRAKGEFESYFDFYNIANFEKSYSTYFDIIEKLEVKSSERVMYLMKIKA
jgi:hypothetical protein